MEAGAGDNAPYDSRALVIVSATGQKNAGQKNKKCYFSVLHFSVSVVSGRNDDQRRLSKDLQRSRS
jgi:hypothetical protein